MRGAHRGQLAQPPGDEIGIAEEDQLSLVQLLEAALARVEAGDHVSSQSITGLVSGRLLAR